MLGSDEILRAYKASKGGNPRATGTRLKTNDVVKD
jgi:hypothetical protein